MRLLSSLSAEEMKNKRCLLRLNLDIKDPEKDSLRIESSIPTIKFILEQDTKVLILSHRGRPEGVDLKLSLKPLIDILLSKISQFPNISLSNISYLENLRFDPREQQNDDQFAKELAAQGDFYVNDDFAVSHRANASVEAITKYLPSYAGFLLEKEVKNLSQVMNNPKKPLVIIIGGIKIDDKVGMIDNFIDKADYFLMGSAYIGIKDLGFKIQGDLKNKIIWPEDLVDGFDIGPRTIEKYSRIISQAKTIIWNGPMGKFEEDMYLIGSKAIADVVASSGVFSVIGGGDTDQLISQLGLRDKFSFISTGGGAMLEFLAGKKLPALEALSTNDF